MNNYASAELQEGDDMSPLEFNLDAPSGPGPYSSVVQNILSRHCAELRTQSESVLLPLHQISKKRLREVLTKQNNDLFRFLQRPDRTPNPAGIAETIFRRYGHDVPNLCRNSSAISREVNVDVSMNNAIVDIDSNLQRHGGTNTTSLVAQLKWVFTQYRNLGEEILRLETLLLQKANVLDKLQQRMPLLTSLAVNDALPSLLEQFSVYLEKTFQDSKFEEVYKQLVEVYKKWLVYREIVNLQLATSDTPSTEPMCGICLTDSIAFAVVPCGHTFCTGCSRKMNMACYLCRGTIREKLKLYFN